MKTYQSHKVVKAAKILSEENSADDTHVVLTLEGAGETEDPILVEKNWYTKNTDNGKHSLANGYLVQYKDGYQSWSPAEAFESGYTEVATQTGLNESRENLSFSDALKMLKLGKRVAREGWNGRDMFLFLVDGSTFQVNRAPLNRFYEEGTEVNYHAHIDMRTADGQIVPWLCSQSDALSEDWIILD